MEASSPGIDLRAGLNDLRAFVAVARLGTVAKAAELLGRTQPSVSIRLAALESAWETKLFRRVARGMELTPEGARLLPMAESVLHDLERLEREAGIPHGEARELRVGSGDALGRRLLPRALSKMRERSPELAVRLREGNGPALMEALREGEIDLALIVAPHDLTPPSGVRCTPLFTSPIAVLEPSDREDDELDGVPLVTLQQGSSFRRHLEAQFQERGWRFDPTIEVGNLSLVRRFVMTGFGVALVPQIAFSTRSRSSRYRMVERPDLAPVEYAYATRDGVPMPQAVEELLERLQQ